MPLGLLTWLRFPVGHAVAAAAHLDVQVLAIHAGSLWPNAATSPDDIPTVSEVVQHVHDVNRQLMVWCPNRAQSRNLVSTGVDALVVDDVPRNVRVRSRRRGGADPGGARRPLGEG